MTQEMCTYAGVHDGGILLFIGDGCKKTVLPAGGTVLKGCSKGDLLTEVGGHAFVGRSHGGFTLVPVEGANFSIDFKVLESVHDAQGFFNRAAKREVVDQLVADDAVFVDEEETAVGDELSGDLDVAIFVNFFVSGKYAVVRRDGFVDVGHDGVADACNATLFPGGVDPCPVGEFTVRGAAYDGNSALFECCQSFLEADQFRGAYECEVLRVEEEQDIFAAFVLIQIEFRHDCAVDDCVCTELRCLFSDEEHDLFFGFVLKESFQKKDRSQEGMLAFL